MNYLFELKKENDNLILCIKNCNEISGNLININTAIKEFAEKGNDRGWHYNEADLMVYINKLCWVIRRPER